MIAQIPDAQARADHFDVIAPTGPPVIYKPQAPTKFLVVSQSPSPGQQVPLGTQIDISLAVKNDLPLAGLNASALVAAKWAQVGDLMTAIGTNVALTTVLASPAKYTDLLGNDKIAVDNLLKLAAPGGDLTKIDAVKAYSDIAFAYKL